MNNSLLRKFFHVYFIVALLYSMNAWFFWSIINPRIVWVFLALGLFVFVTTKYNKSYNLRKSWFFTLIFLGIVLYTSSGNIFGYIASICSAFPFLLFLFLEKGEQLRLYQFLRHTLMWITGVSLIAWLLYRAGLSFWWYPESFGNYLFENHILYVIDIRGLTQFHRFSGIFVEPGYYGCLIAIILYIERFNFKRKGNWILLAALFFTFSLGGWVLLGIGYIFHAIGLRKFSARFYAIIIFLFVVVFGFTYNDGNNILYERVLYRLEFDQTRGTIVGDNRSNDFFNDWFDTYFITSHEAIYGSQKTYDDVHTGETGMETNIGWRAFVVHYGFVGLISYLLFMFLLTFYYRSSFMVIGLFTLELLFFIQIEHQFKTAYLLIFYLAGIAVLSHHEQSSCHQLTTSTRSI